MVYDVNYCVLYQGYRRAIFRTFNAEAAMRLGWLTILHIPIDFDCEGHCYCFEGFGGRAMGKWRSPSRAAPRAITQACDDPQ